MEDFTNNRETFQASFNLAQHFIFTIAGYLTEGGTHFLNGRLDKYFWSLVLVKRRIYAFLEPDEKLGIDALEREIKGEIPKLIIKTSYSEPKIVEKLENYDAMIMEYLRKYGLLVPPKRDRTKLIS